MKTKRLIALCLLLISMSGVGAYAQVDRDARVRELKAKLEPALLLSIEALKVALSLKVHELYDGAVVIADDEEHTFLGKIDSNVASDSIFNDVGRHGSSISSTSIWNEVGRFGSEVARHSPFNEVSSTPPLILRNGKVIGRLTVNTIARGAVDPHWLKMFYK